MVKQPPEIGTPEFRQRNRGNLEWRGDERTVHKAISLRHPTRASYLHAHRVISEAEKDMAERTMNLYTLAGCTIKGLNLMDEPGGTLPLDCEVTKKDELRGLIRKLGSYWPTMHFEFLEELQPGVEHYRTSLPHPLQVDNIKTALGKVDVFFYEWNRECEPNICVKIQNVVDTMTERY